MADLDVLKASPNTETLTLFSVQSSGRTKSRGAGATAHDIDPIQLYLNEIGETPLLTADEEVVVARAALAGDESSQGRLIQALSSCAARHFEHTLDGPDALHHSR